MTATLGSPGRRDRRAVSTALESELAPKQAEALRAALLGMIERHGDLEHVRANRSRALW